MREMKNSGIEWIGSIPTYWALEKVKYHFANIKEIAGIRADDFERLALTMKGVIKRPKDDVDGLQPADFNAYQILNKNDLVFKLIDLQNVSTSRVGLSPYTGLVSPAYIRLVKTGNINPKFAEYFFLMMWRNDVFNHLGDSGVRSSLNSTDLLNISICVPNYNEQTRIANFLDSKCSEIDSLITDIKVQIETLEQYKRSVITEAVTKGLDSNVETKDSGISWAAQIPSHWQTMSTKYLMHKIKNIQPVYSGENILSLTMNGVVVRDLDAGGKMPASFDGYQIVEPHNLLMCLFDIDVTPRCVGLIMNNGLTSPAYSQFKLHALAKERYYYYYFLMLDFTKELLHLAKNIRHSLTEEQLGYINQVVPPINEQIAISDFLDTKCAEIDACIATKQGQLSTLEAYKKSLIYEYVTGKKEVI